METTLTTILIFTTATLSVVTLVVSVFLSRKHYQLSAEVDLLSEVHGIGAGAVERILPYLADLLMNLIEKKEQAPKDPDDHSFIIKVIEEVSKVSRIIRRFDDKANGVKPIKRSADRILTNLQALGYECTNLLGMKYSDGSTLVVQNFINDESLPEGSMVISKVLQQEIKFFGSTIQEAVVEVSQNG